MESTAMRMDTDDLMKVNDELVNLIVSDDWDPNTKANLTESLIRLRAQVLIEMQHNMTLPD